ncbi:MAG: helix-turn-helix domain-containing protein [Muribaculaceae bacterium]|nr:helix-turn-helix domain-containing protein [Roseburia sp.]MCM1430864.1 helix-turn-helix domain-containing protein [Muribaculaceae bacterium]MCM1492843.1 helix-turn-helix domain-containing protein [Muribaculaceae bacterium]
MNQFAIGSFLSKKRREKNLTQEQLAEKLGVSNKTISKWEMGKCMPDYGILLIVMGIALQALSYTFGGSGVKDFYQIISIY